MDEAHFAQEYQPTLRDRFWRSLGFGVVSVSETDNFLLRAQSEGWMCTHVTTKFSFLDRLRILCSARVRTIIVHDTDPPVRRSEITRTTVEIVPPWA